MDDYLFSVALQVSVEASAFVFGSLANIEKMSKAFQGEGFVFAFMALPSILFFLLSLPFFIILGYFNLLFEEWHG